MKLYGIYGDVLSYFDYYSFGMEIPKRSGSSDSYRFGYGGHEKDDNVKGDGNAYNMGVRLYDPRLGRTPSPDPYEYL